MLSDVMVEPRDKALYCRLFCYSSIPLGHPAVYADVAAEAEKTGVGVLDAHVCVTAQQERRRLINTGIEVRASTIPNAGRGLFATTDICKGEIICEYTGRHFRSRSKRQDGPYMFQKGASFIDADPRIPQNVPHIETAAWAANHNSAAHRINTMFRHSARLQRIFLVARIGIRAGSEIFVDYSYDPVKVYGTRVSSKPNLLYLPEVTGEEITTTHDKA